MSKRDPMDEVRRILADMKANGVTIHTTPAPGREASFGERAMGVIDREARALGMTYGDDPAPVSEEGADRNVDRHRAERNTA